MNDDLKRAYLWRRQTEKPGGTVYPQRLGPPGGAVHCLAWARVDVAAGVARYPAPVKPWPAVAWYEDQKGFAGVEDPARLGLRLVGRVVPESDNWDRRGDCGWHTDPFGDVFKDGSGLCFGVVYQLAGRDGHARFIGGYEFGGVDGGPTLDFGNVFSGPADTWNRPGTADDLDATRKAARHADALAKEAGKLEREYQTAWQAGAAFAHAGENIADNRAELLAVLAERRTVKGSTGYPALCKAIKSHVRHLLGEIRKAQRKRAKLRDGDSAELYFWPGEERLRAAFNEAAGETVLPVAG